MKLETKQMTASVITKSIALIVRFCEQQKKIFIASDASVRDVEKAVIHAYGFRAGDFLCYQIQFYDRDFQQFIDLDERLEDDLRALLNYLSSLPKPCLTDKCYQLRLIAKTVKRKRES